MQENSRVMKQALINNGKVVENQENDGGFMGSSETNPSISTHT